VLIGRPANRPLVEKEAVLLSDIRLSGTFDVRVNLRPGERSLTLAVKPANVVPGLRVGDEVEILLAGGDTSGPPGAADPVGGGCGRSGRSGWSGWVSGRKRWPARSARTTGKS